MGLKYENLDAETRKFMLEEIDMDISADTVYRSSYLNQSSQGAFPDLMRAAAETGTDDTLAASLRGRFNATTTRRKPKGGYYTAAVPYNAAEVLAESEFNRYYVRGLCRRAVTENIPHLEVYRAKQVMQPRRESEAKIGLLADPQTLLMDVRNSQENGFDTALGIPPGPGSGITVRIRKS
jgi:hypothetical protein